MAAKRKRAKTQQKKVNVLFATVIAIIISFLFLSWLSEGLHFKYIPTLTQLQDFFAPETHIESDGDCEVHFVDVEQGDCELILCNGKVILIDAGERDQGEKVVKYLSDLNIKKIDYLIATHPHSDHIGGLKDVVENLEIGKIIMPKLQDDIVPTTKVYTDLLTAIANKGLKITPAKVNDKYEISTGSTLTILGPNGEFDDLNNMSVIARFDFGNISFLFTGDMEKSAEKVMLLNDDINIKATVLKLGHHGSSTSTSKDFFDAVDPKYGVICVGEDNSYGHPHNEIIDLLNENNTKVYMTSIDKNIVFSIKNGEIEVKTGS